MTLPADVDVRWRRVPAGADRRDVSRALLAELLPGASLVARCARCGGAHGRLRLSGTDAAVSVSYAEGWAFAVSAFGATRVGVDAVPVAAAGLERVLPGADARSWARVEAVLKADGRGLALDPASVRFGGPIPDGADWTARIGDGPALTGWDVVGPAGVVLAVARG